MTGTVENVYSKALFEIGKEEDTLDLLAKELEGLDEVFAANPELVKLLSSPSLATGEKMAALERIFKGRISDTAFNFLCVLVSKNRIRHFSGILKAFRDEVNEYSGIIEVVAVVAMPLKPEIKEKLCQKLEIVAGRKVNLIEKVEPSILGGIILNYGNMQMDSSIKSKLEVFGRQLKSIVV